MNKLYQEILHDFPLEKDFNKAIVTNNKMVYYYLTQIIVNSSNTFPELVDNNGRTIADQVLMDTLLVFRRQVKNEKIVIGYKGKQINIKNGQELADHLTRLFLLVFETSTLNPKHKQAEDFEKKLINGRGFQKLYALKNNILATLRNFGCSQPQEQEDIFHESLLVFWKKLINGELGIYFSDASDKIENCQVYNRKFYQNSKLNTFLTGIAKNLFMNRTRSAEYKTSSDLEPGIAQEKFIEVQDVEHDNPLLIMFYYYRHFVETRKTRTMVSLLQYDCNLEEKEIRHILGINNARIHSSRLKAHFTKWYEQHQNKSQEIADEANDYFKQRASKNKKLNKKISTIDLYQRKHANHIDLEIYKEEFHSEDEFTQNAAIFKNTFYFTSMGKSSALTGLPDETLLKDSMATFKKELLALQNIQIILFLLFYGTNEPESILMHLVESFQSEVMESAQNKEMNEQFGALSSINQPVLTEEIYQTNCLLFENLSNDSNFNKLTAQHENL